FLHECSAIFRKIAFFPCNFQRRHPKWLFCTLSYSVEHQEQRKLYAEARLNKVFASSLRSGSGRSARWCSLALLAHVLHAAIRFTAHRAINH
ncbi:MAG: hypothetical protein LBG47_10370, partial [Prevotellaceae bacterium]|nr:hypothetical protein [Prevotellaceae bacterium]